MKYEEYAGGNGKKRPTDASQIESDVEMIRNEMAETLRQIEAKFSPRSLVDEAIEAIRRWREGPSQFARNLGLAIRDNPIPVLLTGIGVVSLLVSQRRGPPAQLGEGEPSSARRAAGAAQEKLSEVSQRGREGAQEVRRRGREMAESTSQRIAQTRGAVESAGRRAQDVVHEQPLVVVGLGLALGALLAGTIRMGESERRRVEGIRESFEEGARTKMHEASSGKETASEEHHEASQPTAHAEPGPGQEVSSDKPSSSSSVYSTEE